jgi:hypothetical protein
MTNVINRVDVETFGKQRADRREISIARRAVQAIVYISLKSRTTESHSVGREWAATAYSVLKNGDHADRR